MKRTVLIFPKYTVKSIIKLMKKVESKESLTSKLVKKFHFNKDQVDFVLSFSLKALESEEFHGFSPFYHFINVLKILESKQGNRTAVLVDKEYGRLYVYDRAVAETKPGDSYFKYIEQIWREDVLRLVFTNTGLDRYYLDITNPVLINENEKEIKVEKASLVTWNGLYHLNKFETHPYIITFKLEHKIVIQTEEFMDKKHMRRY